MTGRQKTVSKILEIKEFNKDRIECEVRTAKERLDRELEKQGDLEATYRSTGEDLTNKQMNGAVAAHEVELFSAYMKHLAKQIEHQKSIVAIRVAELDAGRKAMVAAHREQRLIEILHDKIVHEGIKEAGHGEQKEADCAFLSRKAER